jgi:tRNA-Thr(GGU) m(6)t(6)A37 methyltransferase TsaA
MSPSPSANRPHPQTITYTPIGHVQTSWRPRKPDLAVGEHFSKITIRPDLAPGLQGLRVGHFILVLYHCHGSPGYSLLQHPRGDTTRPKRGVFTLRSAHRPNPIGLIEVKVATIAPNELGVCGLDALDGTPVLDIKSTHY